MVGYHLFDDIPTDREKMTIYEIEKELKRIIHEIEVKLN
jgi:hypothetical protein